MRKVYAHSFRFLLTLAFCLVSFYWANGQCVPRSAAYHGELLPNNGCASFASSGAYGPGEYFRTPLLLGASYSFSTCGNSIDTQITGFQGNNTTTSIFYNDDNGPICGGTQASLTYVSTFTDYVRINVNQYNCRPGGTASITVRVRQNNNLSFTSSGNSICQGGTRSLTASPAPVPSANTGSGDLGSFSGTGVSGSTFTAPTPAGASQNFNLTYTFGYCSTTQTISVFANPSTANAGQNQTICSGTATLGASAPAIGSGTWTVTSGPGTVTNPTAPNSTVTGLSAATPTVLTWTVTNGPCTASADNVTITREANPTASNAGPNQTVCASSATLAGNTPSVGNGQWTLVGGSGTVTTPGSPTSGVTGLGVGSNTFRWTITNGSCTASTDDVVITRDQAPTASAAGPDQDVCGTGATLAANSASVGNGSWSVIAGSGTLTAGTNPNTTVTGLSVGANTFVWSITNGTCPPSTDTVTITRFDPPSAANAGADFSVCGSAGNLNATTPSTGTGTWSLIGGSGTIASPNSPNSMVTGLGVGPNTFRWTVTSGPCTATTDDVVITGNAIPSAPSVSGNNILCEGESTSLTAVSGPGLAYEWFDADSAGNSLSTSPVFNTMPLDSNVTYWVEAQDTNSGCSSPRVAMMITVNPLPGIPVAQDTAFSICSDDTIPAFVMTVDSTETVDWYDAATGGSILAMGSTSFTPTAAGTFYAESRDTATGCVSDSRVELTLEIRPDVVATFTFDDSNCPDVAFTDGSTGNAATWSWNFGDQNSSTQQNPSNTYAANGNYVVQLISTNDCGADTTTQTVAITCIVGIEEPDVLGAAINIYPNPNQGTFTVSFSDLNAQEVALQIIDMQGRIVLTRELNNHAGDFETQFDLSNSSKGIYFVKVFADGKVATKKVIVQ